MVPILSLLAVVFAVAPLSVVIYRIFFHPLSAIPGPRVAAATGWYEFYFDCILCGQYYFEVQRMHRKYGPIVRISPREVHIDDPEFFDKLYTNTTKFDKDPWYYDFLNRSGSIFGTSPHEQHRMRRGPMAKYFSASGINKIDPLVTECIALLCQRIEEHRKNGQTVNLSNAFRSLAMDVVSEYALPSPRRLLDHPTLGSEHALFLRNITHISLWNRHFPFILPLFDLMPRSLVAASGDKAALDLFDTMGYQKEQAALIVANKGAPLSAAQAYPNIMNGVYLSDLPAPEKTPRRLFEESALLVGAGTETTGNTLATTFYFILSHPKILRRLQSELGTLDPSKMIPTANGPVHNHRELESLPFLLACVREGLRLATGVSGRLPRVNPHADVIYAGKHLIPAGQVVSMNIRDIHYDPAVFDNPTEFRPDRWLEGDVKTLEKYLVPFSRGSRNCIGQTLAMAEMKMCIANLLIRFPAMRLYETDFDDVAMAHDMFAPFPPRSSAGLQVSVE